MGDVIPLYPITGPPRWEVFVPGDPKTTQTGRVIRLGNGRRIPTRYHPEWSKLVGDVAGAYAPPVLFTGALAVAMRFRRRRPKSLKQSVIWPTMKPDLLNLAQGLCNALNKVVWDDDARILSINLEKTFAEPDELPGVFIQVRTV